MKKHKNSSLNNVKLSQVASRSQEVQQILTTPPRWITRWGNSLIFLFLLIIIFLSTIIKFPDTINSKIFVSTKYPAERIVSRFTGQIESIFVNDGDSISSLKILAIIKNTSKTSDVFYLKNFIDSFNLSSNRQFRSNLVLGDIEQPFLDFEKNLIEFRKFQNLNPHSTKIVHLRNSLDEAEFQLETELQKQSILEKQFNLEKSTILRFQKLYKKGVISISEFEKKEMQFLKAQEILNVSNINISKTKELISSFRNQLEETKYNDKNDFSRLITDVNQSYHSLKKSLVDWEYQYVLKSSISGVLSFQEFLGENQLIEKGQIVFTILPSEDFELIGKLSIPSQNAGKVQIHQKVLIKADNYPFDQFGMLTGIVENISISPDKDGNYSVLVSIPNGTTTTFNRTLPFNQELLGNAEIITEDLSILQRIFYKFREIFKYQK